MKRQLRPKHKGIPVCIFAKPPFPGRVKTRLAEAVGNERAAQLACAMLQDVWSVVGTTAGVIPVLAAAEVGDFKLEVSRDKIWLQKGADLGSRIESILRRALEQAPAAIALGADSPLVTAPLLTEAIEQLELGNAVLGPCHDGGFYLLGLNSCPAGLLADLPWSCAVTCDAAEYRLRLHRMTVTRIPTSFDVDIPADIQQLRRELSGAPPEIAPQTRKWLDEFAWSAS